MELCRAVETVEIRLVDQRGRHLGLLGVQTGDPYAQPAVIGGPVADGLQRLDACGHGSRTIFPKISRSMSVLKPSCARSITDERSLGKKGVRPCSFWWSPHQS